MERRSIFTSVERRSIHVKMVLMAAKSQRTERRSDSLSRERIVDAAIEILDADGANGLTFRTLASRLATGSGAIYWHIASKDDLRVAATDAVIARAMTDAGSTAAPLEAIRTIAVGVFDAIESHPWVGAELAREPWQAAVLQIFEGIGGQLQALGVPPGAQFDFASALISYILGLAAQFAAGVRALPPETDRSAFLATVAALWTRHDPATFPFVHRIATQLADHDDRKQFLAGIDLFLAGIATVYGTTDPQ